MSQLPFSKYDAEFRKDHPETIGETDKTFDLSNYCEWLEKRVADRDALRAELDLVHGAIRADDERLYAAWVRIHGAPDDCANIACDAFEWMADEILRLRAELERTKGELERVRGLLMVALPHVEASAGAQHLMDGFRPRKRPLDDAVEEIRAALERKGEP